jgi:hypothetical protein
VHQRDKHGIISTRLKNITGRLTGNMKNSHINKPNFFILGAGRSGSTHLHHLLKQHPNIYLTRPKEPTFFCKPFQVIKNPIDYYELYDAVADETVIGEASHAYLSNPGTAGVLKALFPESKFVVILRNPADRAYSLYHWMRRHGFEYINSFEAALIAEESRYQSIKFQKKPPQYFYNSMYFRSGLYGEQLQRYFTLFPKQQFHIIKFEDFIANPTEHLKGIFEFLAIDQCFTPQFEVTKNQGEVTSRFPEFQYFLTVKLKQVRIARKLYRSLPNKLTLTTIPPLSKNTKEYFLERCSSDLEDLYNMAGISFL